MKNNSNNNKTKMIISDEKNNFSDEIKNFCDFASNSVNSKIEISNNGENRVIKGSFDSNDGLGRISFAIEQKPYLNKVTQIHSKKLSQEERIKAVGEMYKSGMKQKDIASILMCSQQTVSSDLKKLNELEYKK